MTVSVIQYIWRGYNLAPENYTKWLEYLKSVFLEIPNVTSWSVFQNQVTIMEVLCEYCFYIILSSKNFTLFPYIFTIRKFEGLQAISDSI